MQTAKEWPLIFSQLVTYNFPLIWKL